MKKFLAFVVVVAGLGFYQQLNGGGLLIRQQVLGDAVTAPTLYGCVPGSAATGGRCAFAPIQTLTGVELVMQTNGTLELRVNAAPGTSQAPTTDFAVRQGDGSWRVTNARITPTGTIEVKRNGVEILPAREFTATRTAGVLNLQPLTPWEADELVWVKIY